MSINDFTYIILMKKQSDKKAKKSTKNLVKDNPKTSSALKKKLFDILPILISIVFGLIMMAFIKGEILLTLGFALIVLVNFFVKYHKREWLLFALGFFSGIFFEVLGDVLFKLQYWAHGSLFGLPFWLPLMWGFGFVAMRRIGNIVVED